MQNKRKTTTIRMSAEMKMKVEMYAKLLDIKQSDFIRQSIEMRLDTLSKIYTSKDLTT
jgi:predicted DNA-binding protein